MLDEAGAKKLWKKGTATGDTYQEIGDRGEQVNRAALYERCAVNLCVPNGPATLAWLGHRMKAITFAMINDHQDAMTRDAWRRRGFVVGSQFHGVENRTRFVWEPDTADVIVRETLDFLGRQP